MSLEKLSISTVASSKEPSTETPEETEFADSSVKDVVDWEDVSHRSLLREGLSTKSRRISPRIGEISDRQSLTATQVRTEVLVRETSIMVGERSDNCIRSRWSNVMVDNHAVKDALLH
jgi:hypothetical protein